MNQEYCLDSNFSKQISSSKFFLISLLRLDFLVSSTDGSLDKTIS